ncbi:putative ammonium transporter 2 [Ptychodera flava]|uniref:putative ammonium transporter 2 n=1 Tax=Ptychodera flava TaxID=63121 RepID=UPI00396AA27D
MMNQSTTQDNVTVVPTTVSVLELGLLWDDATWVLSCTFIIFTMQSGFGLLESGSVSQKNETNIMVKNAVDVIFGGFSYWAFGFGLSFGKGAYVNSFCGFGDFFVDETGGLVAGSVFSEFFFHASFATTATTIVSGSMAERTKLEAYIVFSFLNTLVYCFPSHWIWDKHGWLHKLGVIDLAGVGVVHLVGGVTGLVATIVLKPRHGRFEGNAVPPQMSSPTTALLGMFMLWWGWLGFNCGSTYGITEGKWILAARSAVVTTTASIGGGVSGIILSYIMKKRTFDINFLINGVLGSLVSVTGICAFAQAWEGFVIGSIGGLLACLSIPCIAKLKIDDPVNVIPIHFVCAVWGMLAVGLFLRQVDDGNSQFYEGLQSGLFYGGGWYLLGVQSLALVTLISWTAVMAFIFLNVIDVIIGLRVPIHEELLGADIVEHGLYGTYDKKTRILTTPDGKHVNIRKINEKRKTVHQNYSNRKDILNQISMMTSAQGQECDAFGFHMGESEAARTVENNLSTADLKTVNSHTVQATEYIVSNGDSILYNIPSCSLASTQTSESKCDFKDDASATQLVGMNTPSDAESPTADDTSAQRLDRFSSKPEDHEPQEHVIWV